MRYPSMRCMPVRYIPMRCTPIRYRPMTTNGQARLEASTSTNSNRCESVVDNEKGQLYGGSIG